MRLLLPAAALIATQSHADAPNIVVDIAPLHSLVAQLTAGITEPTLLLPPGASPHDYALRPSDAQVLADADVVIWMGEALTPWLGEPIETLATQATIISIMDLPGWTPLALRDDPRFETQDGHDHDDHDDHARKDPHAWLNPANALLWMVAITDELGDADPSTLDTYENNLAAMRDTMAAIGTETEDKLMPVLGSLRDGSSGYFVPHDSLQYFEQAYEIPAAGALGLSDDTPPGPAHLRDLQSLIEEQSITCILTDPHTNPATVAILTEGTDIRTAMIDPEGTTFAPGPDLYGDLMRTLATTIADCLKPK